MEKVHSGLCPNHHKFNWDKDINEIFTGYCKEPNHNDELEFFCKSHNKLCCAKCIIKIKSKGKGQHRDCEVFNIEEIKNEKKEKLKENIIKLEEFLNKFEETINWVKVIFEKMNENKEEIKLSIQKVFTKLRNEINNREDQLLAEVDNYFIEKGKAIENEWKDETKIISLINDCINIEDDMSNIKIIDNNIQKYSAIENKKIIFYPILDEDINKFLQKVKDFGCIFKNVYKFRKCPLNTNRERKYKVSGIQQNVAIKNIGSNNYYSGIICVDELEKGKINKWKIKILNTKDYDIRIGIVSKDFDNNDPIPNKKKSGWYYSCSSGYLYSGPPENIEKKQTDLKVKKDEIIVIMDMNKGTLKFIIDDEDKGDSFSNIPIDNPLFPSVLIGKVGDSVEISEFLEDI